MHPRSRAWAWIFCLAIGIFIHGSDGPPAKAQAKSGQRKTEDPEFIKPHYIKSMTTYDLFKNEINGDYLEFDRLGRKILRIYYTSGLVSWKNTYRYDEAGNLLEEKKFDPYDHLTDTHVHAYDKDGRRVRWEQKYEGTYSEKMCKKITSTYDDQGNEIESVIYDYRGEIEDRYQNSFDGKGNKIKTYRFFEGKPFLEWAYRHDDYGRKVEAATYYYRDGSLINRWTYKYDAQGHQIEETTLRNFWGDEENPTWRLDASGKPVERKYFVAGRLRETQIFKYDGAGNEVEWIVYKGNGRLDFRTTTKYDERGLEIESVLYGVKTSGHKFVYRFYQ